MESTSTRVRRQIAVQFAFSHLFYPAMICMVVGLASIVLVVLTQGRYGVMFLLFIGSLLLALILGAAILTAAAYRHPRLARKQIDAFVKTQQAIVTVYEEGQARLARSLESLEEEWDERLRAAWRKPTEQQKQEILSLFDQGLAEANTLIENASNEAKLRNQAGFVELFARMRESEEGRKQIEALPIPELPEELFQEMKQIMQPYLQNSRETLQGAISKLTEHARAAEEALAEAQKLA